VLQEPRRALPVADLVRVNCHEAKKIHTFAIAFILVVGLASYSQSREFRVWTYKELQEMADLVVISHPSNVRLLNENLISPIFSVKFIREENALSCSGVEPNSLGGISNRGFRCRTGPGSTSHCGSILGCDASGSYYHLFLYPLWSWIEATMALSP